MTTATASSSLKLLMAQKRQQLKAQPLLTSPSSIPISIITPEDRRLLQPAPPSSPADDAADVGRRSKGRPVLRKKRPMVFDLVTQSPTRQSPLRAAAALTPPSCHPSHEHSHRSPRAGGPLFELVMDKPVKAAPPASNRLSNSNRQAARRVSVKAIENSVVVSKSTRANKENKAVEERKSAAPSKSTATATISPTILPQPRPAKARPSVHASSASSTLSFLCLRQRLSALPQPLLEAEIVRIHALSARPFPILPSLYFASVPLSLLLQWLQTVALAQSTSHSSPRYLVDNFTSALSDGVVLLLLLHYYHSTDVHYDDILWHDAIKTVDSDTFGAAQTQPSQPPSDDDRGEREVGWVGAFSFAELTRVQQTAAEKAAIVNWGLIKTAVRSLAPRLDCVEGFGSGEGRVEEAKMVVFLCDLSGLLLSRSAEVHAARRIQRWWRRRVQRRVIAIRVRQYIVEAREEAAAAAAVVVQPCELEVSRVEGEGEEEDELVDVSLDLPPPTPSRALRHSLLLLDWNDPTTLQQARLRAEEAQRASAMETAVQLLQRMWRGKLGRRTAMAVRLANVQRLETIEHEQREAAAVCIQRLYRGWRLRKDLSILMQLKAEAEMDISVEKERREQLLQRQQCAALLLQTAVRGWLARRLLSRLQEEQRLKQEREDQREAQARVDARQRTEDLLQTHIAAHVSRIQLRQRLARAEEQRMKEEEAALAVQRRLQAEKEDRLSREAYAKELQRQAEIARILQLQREEEERQQLLAEEEEAKRAEAEAQRVEAEAELARRTAAASTIQRAWRNWHKTARVVEELREEIHAARLEGAVITMQAIVRGRQARRLAAQLRAERQARQQAEREERAREEKRREERQRLLHRVQSLNATTIQTQLRVFLAHRLLHSQQAEYAQRVEAQRQHSAAVIQACWRGYRQRKQTPHLLDLRRTLVRLQHRRTASQSMEGRTRTALAALQSSQSLATITRAVHTLSVTSTLACVCESQLLPALPALFSLIRSCNRSPAHQQLLLLCLTTLNNVAAHEATQGAVYEQTQSAEVLVEQLQVYRDHGRIMRRLVSLLERGVSQADWVQGMVEAGEEDGGSVVRRVEAVCELLERKTRSERLLGKAWWGGEEKVRAIREMGDIAKRLRAFLAALH